MSMTSTTTTESLYEVRREALRLAVQQAPGAGRSWSTEEAVARAEAYFTFLRKL